MTDTLVTINIQDTHNVSQGEIEETLNHWMESFPFKWRYISMLTKRSNPDLDDSVNHLRSSDVKEQTLRSVPGGTCA